MLNLLKNNYIFPKVSSQFRNLCSFSQKKNNRLLVDMSVEEGPLRLVFPAIREEIIEEHLVLKDNSELRDRCEKLIDYNANVETPFLPASLLFLHTYKLLEKPSLLNDENLKKAYILAWCHKLDDVLDLYDLKGNILKTSCNDISLGRPTWLSMEAYKRASAAQKKILEEHFGKNCEESTEKILAPFGSSLKLRDDLAAPTLPKVLRYLKAPLVRRQTVRRNPSYACFRHCREGKQLFLTHRYVIMFLTF
ncbi:unnamed protein product [Phyllotreta striolata]|uniref:Uncharacterized protein n=1 Tax=Phyllotreta striolata TaxID=444603 RepID=A0A9N9XII9_PHYSR|nr:unnamed protein product [Phyllotreta striolata]